MVFYHQADRQSAKDLMSKASNKVVVQKTGVEEDA